MALYSQAKGLDPDVAEVLWEVVKRMDAADRQWAAENVDQDDPAPRGDVEDAQL